MYEVSTELEFSAAHFHPDYPGKCRNLHGHNYRVVITVRAEELDKLGMVCDFYDIKNAAKDMIEEFDHKLINDHQDFGNRQPSTENLSQYFFARLQPQLDKDNHWLYCVQVWENDRCSARYIRPQ